MTGERKTPPSPDAVAAALQRVADTVREARAALGLTIQQAADLTIGCQWGSISRAGWGRIEACASVADVVQLRAIAGVLGVQPAVLGFGEFVGPSPEALLIDQFLRTGNQEAVFRMLSAKLPKTPRK